MHGKTSKIFHDEKGVFTDCRTRSRRRAITRCSSSGKRARLPRRHGKTWDEEIMAVRHKTLPVEGVQFHPESFLTTVGKELLRNFLQKKGRPDRREETTMTPKLTPPFGRRSPTSVRLRSSASRRPSRASSTRATSRPTRWRRSSADHERRGDAGPHRGLLVALR